VLPRLSFRFLYECSAVILRVDRATCSSNQDVSTACDLVSTEFVKAVTYYRSRFSAVTSTVTDCVAEFT
jgi:hypothetical protein